MEKAPPSPNTLLGHVVFQLTESFKIYTDDSHLNEYLKQFLLEVKACELIGLTPELSHDKKFQLENAFIKRLSQSGESATVESIHNTWKSIIGAVQPPPNYMSFVKP